jgi:hypothetical protein
MRKITLGKNKIARSKRKRRTMNKSTKSENEEA